jgi:hypothetical protein
MSATHSISELEERECWALLRSAPIARLGFTEGALPVVLPVHFTVRDGEVVISSLAGSKVTSAARGDVVVVEADDYDPVTRQGWTVNAIGPARLITGCDEVAALDELGFAPWTADQRRCYSVVRVVVLRGRTVVRSAAERS